ncbi:MAG: RDD family protein [Terracidiphilus sp.]
MSTLPSTASLFPEWKQEVNRRVAAHMSRRVPSRREAAAHQENQASRASRAAEAAARVAARYAKAPSYSEMLTREARAAVHAAEAASKAAQQAQAAFQYVLDGLESVTPEKSLPRSAPEPQPVAGFRAATASVSPADRPQASARSLQDSAFAPAWELETGAQQDEPAYDEAMPGWDAPPTPRAHSGVPSGTAAPGEWIEPIHANLIEFPREMVATRRARPRRAEGPLAAREPAPQLSIFEVDPDTISIEPPPAVAEPSSQPSWMRAELSDRAAETTQAITLDAPPASLHAGAQARSAFLDDAPAFLGLGAQPYDEELLEEPEPSLANPEIELAPLNRRLLAVCVDWTLIAAALIGAAVLAMPSFHTFPGARPMEIGALLAFLGAGVVYHVFFLTFARATPGMVYAGVRLNSFAGFTASRAQRCRRLVAMLLSIVPLGLGMVWALFDDAHLTWHDRLSGTYVCKRI